MVKFVLYNTYSNYYLAMVRNIGGIANPYLYTKCFSGTKYLIEHYIDKAVECLDWLSYVKPIQLTTSRELQSEPYTEENFLQPQYERMPPSPPPFGHSQKEKYAEFVNFLRIFGRSALVLTGGLSLGNYFVNYSLKAYF